MRGTGGPLSCQARVFTHNQTDRINLSFSAARNLITPELGALRKRIASSSGVAVFDIAGNEYDVQIAGILHLSL